MLKNNAKISIVGAGLSGLAAAINLEKAGFSPVIYEATSEVGGRVKTDLVEGYQLDHGFQVMLDAYPKAKEYFDYSTLDLQRLLPGAIIYSEGREYTLGDPSRYFPFLLPTVESGIASLRDMYLMWKLHRELQSTSIEAIFELPEMSTLDFLNKRGFSQKLLRNFFKPFFSGIFLEPDLSTSSRMFCFVFKMFGQGNAVIPKGGMSALPEQLLQKLQKTVIHYNTPVKKIEEGKITLKDGKEIVTDLVLIATDDQSLIPSARQVPVRWHGCDTLYFETEKRSIPKPLIGLVAKEGSLINNLFYPTSISTTSRGKKELLSVTVVRDHDLEEGVLIEKIKEELKAVCRVENPRFLKKYRINKALPRINSLKASWDEDMGKIGNTIFLAGDYLLYGSSNAALLSGEKAAQAIIRQLSSVK
ncbi:Flavin containing amine oxidoreductase [Muriicola jejuensis]|uniref:NAD(P)-binding protein n=1 Tax=Muriicola jejuensis TaxID=504488 RepID=A0A6P0UJP9_9FLAO|nr:NAD(P)/FAD-dependent oxidoreductase [Muriicola jejuensis]NER11293.1 NAD(P)-binding protein [Muriicola jejuensis]SMP21689.1 Flavin containing amine oxidoreductase [Muriicola jejuensis]